MFTEVRKLAEAVRAEKLKKVYKGRAGDRAAAVNEINFSVEVGEIFGFIGPNGAGKTTTIKMLLGLIFPTSGKALVMGKDAGDIDVKKRISYLPESPYFYDHMNAEEILDFYCSLFRIPKSERKAKIADLLKKVGLEKNAHRALRQYSKGMLQRVGIAQALINDPDLLFFDEPTSGLDPIAHKDIQDLIRSLKDQGKTVFLSSHQLSDVENLCDRVAIINGGEIVKIGTMEELLQGSRTVVTLNKCASGLAESLEKFATKVYAEGDTLAVHTDSEENVHNIIEAARGKAVLASVIPQRQSLEDLFVEIVREGKK